MLNIKKLPVTIASIDAYSEDLKVFRFRLPPGSDFSFVPGQFAMLSLPGLADSNGRNIAKAYSIASSPLQHDTIELCIVHYPKGALSTPLFRLKAGDEAIITGPYGMFQLKQPLQKGTVFIAGGTGIAPLMSMLRSIYAASPKEELWLFYSVSEPNKFLFKEELLGFQKNNLLQLVVSTSNNGSGWLWEKGRVTDTLPKYLEKLNGTPREMQQFYLCGPPVMVADTIKLLVELGFKKDNIHKEQW
ncbi:MAG TPA: FAD-dependent oxidoreductase [Candidatus Nanoarchaeia archaeon]|nr:FAD-dependent oxidoreductase [Candidatus Nanoarchaeia archaeon]